ncbi:hypothetical protein BBJ28_00008759 [Nothophytophthora sp. Chile5]|nr:hypothetical protein BBJ28_00008759 [Nothophytophthora sp. Chile5]
MSSGDGLADGNNDGDENAVTPYRQETPAVVARSPTPRALPPPSHKVYLNSYELVRLGYLVFGEKYLITFDEWDLLTSMAPLRSYSNLWNHCVLVWTLQDASTDVDDAGTAGGRVLLSLEPEMWRLDDPRLSTAIVKQYQTPKRSVGKSDVGGVRM